MPIIEIHAKFNPGRVVATPAIMAKVPPEYAVACLQQHLSCQWGLLNEVVGSLI